MTKTLLCIDMANLHYYLDKKGWEIHWRKFKEYLCGLYGEILFILYDGIMSKAHFRARYPGTTVLDYYYAVNQKEKFFKFLKRIGFEVESKYTVQTYNPATGQLRHKCNFDVEITMDALIRINDYNRFVLCSGDRDFLKLIKYLNGEHKETVLVYPKDRTSKEFRESTTGKSFTIGSLRHIVGRPKRPAKNKDQPQPVPLTSITRSFSHSINNIVSHTHFVKKNFRFFCFFSLFFVFFLIAFRAFSYAFSSCFKGFFLPLW